MRFKKQMLSSLVGILFLFLILTSTASGSIGIRYNKSDFESINPKNETNFFLEDKSLDVNRVVRVAIYDENNLTIPSYVAVGGYHNNLSGLVTILSARQEYEITYLWRSDLDNYARLSGYLYQPGEKTDSPGMEALFRDHTK